MLSFRLMPCWWIIVWGGSADCTVRSALSGHGARCLTSQRSKGVPIGSRVVRWCGTGAFTAARSTKQLKATHLIHLLAIFTFPQVSHSFTIPFPHTPGFIVELSFKAFRPPAGQRPWSSRILSVGKAAMGFKDVPGRGVAAHCKICFPLPKILQEGDTKYTIPVPSFASLLFLVRRNGDFFFCSGPEANHFCQLLKELLTRTATTRDSSCNPELELALSLSISLCVYIYIFSWVMLLLVEWTWGIPWKSTLLNSNDG